MERTSSENAVDSLDATTEHDSHNSILAPYAVDTPLSPLCLNCQSLFSRPNKHGSIMELVHDEESFAISVRYCHICAAIKREDPTNKKAVHLALIHAMEGIGEVPFFMLKTLEMDLDGNLQPTPRMMFYATVQGSNTPSIQVDPVDDSLNQSSVVISPTLKSRSTEDEPCFDLIRHWLQVCTHEHELCRQFRTKNDFSTLPTRLIDVREGIRLVDTASCDLDYRQIKYATVSHRWHEGNTIKLLQSNMENMKQDIEPSALIPVFRDSIDAARRLGIDYVWIDAMCIVQDDPEDWRRESSLMGLVYRNAFLNLGASAAALVRSEQSEPVVIDEEPHVNASVGLYVSRDTSAFSMSHVEISQLDYSRQHFGFTYDLLVGPSGLGPLVERGWVLQERLLSPRSVYFGQRLTWECPELFANENFHEGSPSGNTGRPWNSNNPLRLASLLERPKYKGHQYAHGLYIKEIYRTWLYLVESYRKCRLTFENDALPALSGLASSFQAVLGDEYLAGIWRQDIIRGLLWSINRENLSKTSTRPLEQYRASSWSWASTNLPIVFPHVEDTAFTRHEAFVADIHEAQVTLASSNPMDPISDGFIKISGFLRPNQNTKTPTAAHGWCLTSTHSFFEAHDWEYDEQGVSSCEGSAFLVLTYRYANGRASCTARVRGLILKLTGNKPDEYRRIGAFALDPTVRPEFADFDIENLDKHTISIV